MDISIVVPTYNSGGCIGECLQRLFEYKSAGDEVIVVDDASLDDTSEIAKNAGARIIALKENCGPANARLEGQEIASHGIIAFIDSDVLIQEDTLERIRAAFSAEQDIEAVVGLFSKEHPNPGFFSNYKNLYMNYIFNRCPEKIDFLFGSIFAIRKGCLKKPAHNDRFGEDSDTGLKLTDEGGIIRLDKGLLVVHMKDYGARTLLLNDYTISYHFTRLFLRRRGWASMGKKGRFSHTQNSQLAGIGLTWLSLLFAPFYWPLSTALIACSYLPRLGFLAHLFRERGLFFGMESVVFAYIDDIAMGAGIIGGIASELMPSKGA